MKPELFSTPMRWELKIKVHPYCWFVKPYYRDRSWGCAYRITLFGLSFRLWKGRTAREYKRWAEIQKWKVKYYEKGQ